MGRRRPRGIEAAPSLVTEIAHIGSSPGAASERAQAVMEQIERVIPFDASLVALLAPGSRTHLSLVATGYDERTRTYLDSPAWTDDLESLGMHQNRPFRRCDLPVPHETVPVWAEYLTPAGFREGLGAALFTPDGRYVGVVGLATETAAPVTDEVRALFGAVAPLVAYAVDPMRSVAAVAATVSDALAGTVVTRAGTALPLPGLPGHAVLTSGSVVLAVAAGRLGEGAVHATFLSPTENEYVRVTVIATRADRPCDTVAVVTLSPPRDLHGLTPRELEVLGVLVQGASNRAIAVALRITERTVAAHLEHILAKLAVPSRTVAAVSALRLGLYVPPELRVRVPPALPSA